MELNASIKVSTGLVVHRTGKSGEAVRVHDSETEVRADADMLPAGGLALKTTGQSRQGEDGTLATARLLVSKLNTQGEAWGEPRTVPEREGCDCIAESAQSGHGRLRIEVQRAIVESSFWAESGRTGSAREYPDPDDAAAVLRVSVEKKALHLSGSTTDVVLALNALDAPGYAFEVVSERFRVSHGQWAAALGFRSIWVVGPTEALTHQLA